RLGRFRRVARLAEGKPLPADLREPGRVERLGESSTIGEWRTAVRRAEYEVERADRRAAVSRGGDGHERATRCQPRAQAREESRALVWGEVVDVIDQRDEIEREADRRRR